MSGGDTEAIATSGPSRPTPSRWRRLARRAAVVVGVLAAVSVVLAAAHRPLLVGFAHLLRVDNPAPSDAIVILLGGTPHRPEKAAELYKRGLAPAVWICRERPDPVYGSDQAELTRQYLVNYLGVPAEAVVILPREVTSIREEALRVGEYLDRHPARRVIVVTTAFHTARARWVFRRVLAPRGVDVRTAAANDPRFDESNWYRNEDGLVAYFSEAVKTVFYRLSY